MSNKTRRSQKLEQIRQPLSSVKVVDTKNNIKSTQDLIDTAKEVAKENMGIEKPNVVLVNLPKNLAERYKSGSDIEYQLFKLFKWSINENGNSIHCTCCEPKKNPRILKWVCAYWDQKFALQMDDIKRDGIKEIYVYQNQVAENKVFGEDLQVPEWTVKSFAQTQDDKNHPTFDIKFKSQLFANRWMNWLKETYPKLRLVKEVSF